MVLMKILMLGILFLNYSCSGLNIKKESKIHDGFDAQLSKFEYPYSVQFFESFIQDQKLQLAYMDIVPQGPIKKTVVLLHGKNFSGYYFGPIIKSLVDNGIRVIVPDQVGFGKSTKPVHFQYSFQIFAKLTRDLLLHINVKDFNLVGHSMGGMIGTRFALMYPESVKKLILINPIGLEDYKTLTSYKSFDDLYKMELNSSEEKIRDYQKVYYYDNNWKPEYEAMIIPAIEWIKGPDKELIARNAALTSELIYTQPVVYEFKNLKMKTTLINGQRDKTAPGKAWAPIENQKIMGDYPQLGETVISQIPQGKLIKIAGIGHLPFVEDFSGFMKLFLPELE